jgi:hypothetical protein
MILIKVENLFLGDCIIEAALNRDFSGFYRAGLTSFRGGGFCRLRWINYGCNMHYQVGFSVK